MSDICANLAKANDADRLSPDLSGKERFWVKTVVMPLSDKTVGFYQFFTASQNQCKGVLGDRFACNSRRVCNNYSPASGC